MHHESSKGPSQRQLRVGEQIRHIVADVMQRGHFHEETLMDAGKITVTEVRTSPDLKNATAYVLFLGGDVNKSVLDALNAEHHVFQKEINRQSNLKFTPRIRFVRDESFEEAQRIESLLREVHIPEDTDDDTSEDG